MGEKKKTAQNKETVGCEIEHSAQRKYTRTACAVTTEIMTYFYCLHTNTTWNKINCRQVDQSLQGESS